MDVLLRRETRTFSEGEGIVMTAGVKIAVIGGGSVYTPELVELLVQKESTMPVREVILMDINEVKLDTMAAFCRRLVQHGGGQFPIRVTNRLEEAIPDADYVLIQWRAGDNAGRVTDEQIGLTYHIPFVETISVCGVGTFLRSAPLYDHLVDLLQHHAPQARVMNFANPAGPLTQYLHRRGVAGAIGVCNVSILVQRMLAEFFQADPSDFYLQMRGLNHLTVTDAIYHKRENVLAEFLAKTTPGQSMVPFSRGVLDAYPALLNPYFQYYLHGTQIVNKLAKASKTRGQEVLEIEHQLYGWYGDLRNDSVPDLLRSRGGTGYSRVVVELMASLHQNDHRIHYVNVRNNGILRELPDDTVVEVPALARDGQILPIHTGPLPRYVTPLMQTMAEHYRILIEATLERRLDLLRQALLVHPLFPDADVADHIIEDLLAVNRPYIEGFR